MPQSVAVLQNMRALDPLLSKVTPLPIPNTTIFTRTNHHSHPRCSFRLTSTILKVETTQNDNGIKIVI
ncbi:uncharacterized protein G2W53_005510 [Senna tora]|uniref:Uncharacterized protein n=1 Tax=Senna tora TaxID=362788 RepID=A0A834X3R0_9FABA|nr:uncharacterized protein G2W53_005510 [Senna tora]